MRPADYGVVHQPGPAYAMVYPLPSEELTDLAYFFVDGPGSQRSLAEGPGLRQVRQRVKEWAPLFERGARLHMTGAREIADTRTVATRPVHHLSEQEAALYRACETAQTVASLRRTLGVEPELERLVADRLLLRQGERYLALATQGDLPRLPQPKDFPGGSTMVRVGETARPWMDGLV
jgi:magnesium-protoporphyrin IX monomethyl ester (oxidative) cyclase